MIYVKVGADQIVQIDVVFFKDEPATVAWCQAIADMAVKGKCDKPKAQELKKKHEAENMELKLENLGLDENVNVKKRPSALPPGGDCDGKTTAPDAEEETPPDATKKRPAAAAGIDESTADKMVTPKSKKQKVTGDASCSRGVQNQGGMTPPSSGEF